MKRRRSYTNDDEEIPDLRPTIEVWERDPIVEDTGILDAQGRPLVRTIQMDPIGFLRFPDE